MGKNTGHNDGGHAQRQKEKAQAAAQAAVTQTAAAMSGNASSALSSQSQVGAIPSIPSTGFNPAQSYIETAPLFSGNLTAGLSGKLSSGINIPTQTWDGMTIADRERADKNFEMSLQFEADYGLRELQGQIDKDLARMQYENDQLKTDKMIDNSVWLDRSKRIWDSRAGLQQNAASVLANI